MSFQIQNKKNNKKKHAEAFFSPKLRSVKIPKKSQNPNPTECKPGSMRVLKHFHILIYYTCFCCHSTHSESFEQCLCVFSLENVAFIHSSDTVPVLPNQLHAEPKINTARSAS